MIIVVVQVRISIISNLENYMYRIWVTFASIDVSDVFKIGQIDGVCYYILDKVEHDKCKVVNKSRLQPYFNSENVRNIRSRQSLINVCNEIHMYIDKFQQYKIDSNKLDERYKYSVNKLLALVEQVHGIGFVNNWWKV